MRRIGAKKLLNSTRTLWGVPQGPYVVCTHVADDDVDGCEHFVGITAVRSRAHRNYRITLQFVA
jgi:hypothetical protein